jgi:copper(I)-binding protein
MKATNLITASLIYGSLSFSQTVLADLSIKEGYLREVPPGQVISAAFMQLTNNSDNTVTLIGGSSPEVKAIEVHNHTMLDGVMKMTKLAGLEIEAGKTVSLKPGGLHIMFIGLTKNLQKGTNFSFSLNFQNGESQAVSLPIKSLIK